MVTSCFTNDDMWDFTTDENPEGMEDYFVYSDPLGNRILNELKIYPKWYFDKMNGFWSYIQNIFIKTNDEIGAGDFTFYNNGINLHSYENSISKVSKQLYSEGAIRAPYTLKDMRNYAIITLYEKNKDIRKIQKLLDHTTPNTTRRFLQNIGIEIK